MRGLNQSMDVANLKLKYGLDKLDLDYNVIDKVSQHLTQTESGRKDVLLTPIGKDNDPNDILLKFDEVFEKNRFKMNETLISLENSNRDKYGPRSIAIPWKDRVKSLRVSFENSSYDKIVVKALPGRSNLRPLSLQHALKLLKNNTNSGLPYYTKKGIVKERVLDKYDTLLKRKDPCILFTRTQEQSKTRNVWGFPIADTLNEMRYYSPLLAYQKGLSYRSALTSPDTVSRHMTDLINKSSSGGSTLVSIDFAAYDTSAKSELQGAAFDYIKSLFQAKCLAELNYIEDRFRSIGILTPDGVISGDHGVPSGSTFTNEVDSIIQIIIATSLPYITYDTMQVQGDDGVYLVPLDKVDELFDRFKTNGLNVNGDKSFVSNKFAVFLQNLYHIDYLKDGIIGGVYPVYRALNRIIHQERWSTFEDHGLNGKDYYSIRTICICENCKYHPLFRELVEFILKYDKYSLDVSDQGIANYVQMVSDSKGAGEILNHQYGDNVSGIRNFETFKLIKELG